MCFKNLHEHLKFLFKNSSKLQRSLLWAEVIKVIVQKADTIDVESLHKVCPLFLDALRTGLCGNRTIAAKIVGKYCLYLSATLPRSSFQFGRISSPYVTLWSLEDVPRKSPTWVLGSTSGPHVRSAARRMVSRSADSVFAMAKAHALGALYTGDWKFLHVLIQYGGWDGEIVGLEKFWDCDVVFAEFQFFCAYIGSVAGRYHEMIGKARDIWHGLRENDGRMLDDSQRGFSRIPLILRTLGAVALEPECRKPYLQCLRMYFAALPEPVVSADEVRNILLYLMRDATDRHVVDQLVERYVKIFGGQTYRPRSLAHLCRFSVRKILAKQRSASLPRLIQMQNIPNSLKDFLLGEPESSLW